MKKGQSNVGFRETDFAEMLVTIINKHSIGMSASSKSNPISLKTYAEKNMRVTKYLLCSITGGTSNSNLFTLANAQHKSSSASGKLINHTTKNYRDNAELLQESHNPIKKTVNIDKNKFHLTKVAYETDQNSTEITGAVVGKTIQKATTGWISRSEKIIRDMNAKIAHAKGELQSIYDNDLSGYNFSSSIMPAARLESMTIYSNYLKLEKDIKEKFEKPVFNNIDKKLKSFSDKFNTLTSKQMEYNEYFKLTQGRESNLLDELKEEIDTTKIDLSNDYANLSKEINLIDVKLNDLKNGLETILDGRAEDVHFEVGIKRRDTALPDDHDIADNDNRNFGIDSIKEKLKDLDKQLFENIKENLGELKNALVEDLSKLEKYKIEDAQNNQAENDQQDHQERLSESENEHPQTETVEPKDIAVESSFTKFGKVLGDISIIITAGNRYLHDLSPVVDRFVDKCFDWVGDELEKIPYAKEIINDAKLEIKKLAKSQVGDAVTADVSIAGDGATGALYISADAAAGASHWLLSLFDGVSPDAQHNRDDAEHDFKLIPSDIKKATKAIVHAAKSSMPDVLGVMTGSPSGVISGIENLGEDILLG